MTFTVVDWIFLALALVFVGIGVYILSGGLVRLGDHPKNVYTKDSLKAASPMTGGSAVVFGAAVASFPLLSQTNIMVGPVSIGLIAFVVLFLVSEAMGHKGKSLLVKKEA